MLISLKRLQWDCYEFPHHHNAISTIINQLMTQYHMGLRIFMARYYVDVWTICCLACM